MLIINRKAKILVNEVIENAGGVTSVVTVREGGREGFTSCLRGQYNVKVNIC